jgi:hypothetical protein
VPIYHPTTTLLLLLLLRPCRRESDFAWQLSVPIYHPTTTLLLAVFTDTGRGKLQCLGKLQYRISYLMYLNHRCDFYSKHLRMASVAALRRCLCTLWTDMTNVFCPGGTHRASAQQCPALLPSCTYCSISLQVYPLIQNNINIFLLAGR